MEANAAIDRHHQTLKGLLAIILVYIGLADDTRAAMRATDAPARALRALAEPETLSRRVHKMICKLLLPVEAATRRLVIVLSAGLPAPKIRPSDIKPRKRPARPPKFKPMRRTWQAGVMVPRHLVAQPQPPAPAHKPPVYMPRFALLDPLKRFNRGRRPSRSGQPRIWVPGIPDRTPARRKQTPYDQISDVRLMRRVAALAHALDDLPAQARRLRRWRALQDARRALDRDQKVFRPRRQSPMRPGSPPGTPPLRLRRDDWRDEHVVLADMQWLAHDALKYADTS